MDVRRSPNRSRPIRVAGLLLALVVPVTGIPGTASAAATPSPPPLPRSMAAVGDSISRGYHLNWLFALLDAPQYSWSTGSWPGSTSHYRRIVDAQPQLAGHAYNDARTGARMADLGGQLALAASQHVEYVTVMIGANDVCRGSLAEMTPTATFAAQFSSALAAFLAADPSAHVFVASIPDVYRVWSVLHGSAAARKVWSTFGVCPTVLAAGATSAQRDLAKRRIRDDNAALAAECAAFPRCRFDGYATFDYPFGADQISTVDFFHPNLRGQNALATATWAAGYWG
jgi:lysophospholipase L1-like esterase